MGIWQFWEEYLRALDNLPICQVQGGVTSPDISQLNREPDLNAQKISRFFFSIKKMPKAWGSKPWTSKEMRRAGNVVANDLFRRKIKHGRSAP